MKRMGIVPTLSHPMAWVAIGVFGAVGILAAYFVAAAVSNVSVEAERGALGGSASVIADSNASGLSAVRFGLPPLQPGPLEFEGEFMGTTTGVPVKFAVSVPADYYTSGKEYPVLYYLHGKGDNYSMALPEAKKIRDAVADGAMQDFLVITPDSYTDGRWENGGNGPAEDNFVKELIPYAEANYRIKKGASYRLLTGFSMGGHGAFRFGVKFPDMFAAVLSVDGAMGATEDYTQYIAGVRAKNPQIYAMGGQQCGYRVEPVVNAFASLGVSFTYKYYDVQHDYPTFLAQDRNNGWPAARFLQSKLGRSI